MVGCFGAKFAPEASGSGNIPEIEEGALEGYVSALVARASEIYQWDRTLGAEWY